MLRKPGSEASKVQWDVMGRPGADSQATLVVTTLSQGQSVTRTPQKAVLRLPLSRFCPKKTGREVLRISEGNMSFPGPQLLLAGPGQLSAKALGSQPRTQQPALPPKALPCAGLNSQGGLVRGGEGGVWPLSLPRDRTSSSEQWGSGGSWPRPGW